MPDEPLPPHRATKIVATLGPASASHDTIAQMAEAGMDVARLNFSHANHRAIATLVEHVRAVQESSGRPLAILGDLQGPKLRVGVLDRPLELLDGERLIITVDGSSGDVRSVSCDYATLAEEVTPGTRIYLRDGAIELEVTSVESRMVETVVRRGGELTSRAGLNIPEMEPRRSALTAQDMDDLRFAVEQGMDYVALSFVRHADDLRQARAELRRLGGDAGLVAKIETRAALDQLDAIADESDALMVARGDLGVEVGPENVPPWQRRIVNAAQRRLIPSIVATEMLESMRSRSRPTRAEASDVAHAAWEGADAVMLSAESAIGEFPVESVAMMGRILRRAEVMETLHALENRTAGGATAFSIARAVRELLSHDASIGGVAAFSVTGYSARLIAAGRPAQPILALTTEPRVLQRLALVRGVHAVLCSPVESEAQMLATVEREARTTLGCDDGQRVVLVGAMPIGRGGPTNFLALHVLGSGANGTP